MADDRRRGRVNPYLRRLGQGCSFEEAAEFAKKQANVCLDEACRSYDLLPQKNFSPILRNILFLGLEDVQNSVIRRGS